MSAVRQAARLGVVDSGEPWFGVGWLIAALIFVHVLAFVVWILLTCLGERKQKVAKRD